MLALIDQCGPASDAVLERLVYGDSGSLRDSLPVDVQIGPAEGWML